MLLAFAKKSLANMFAGIFTKYPVPWNWLLPDLMLTFVTPPSVLPKLASKVAVWTLNSCTRSCGGT